MGQKLNKSSFIQSGLTSGQGRKKGVVESEFSMFLYGLVYFYFVLFYLLKLLIVSKKFKVILR